MASKVARVNSRVIRPADSLPLNFCARVLALPISHFYLVQPFAFDTRVKPVYSEHTPLNKYLHSRSQSVAGALVAQHDLGFLQAGEPLDLEKLARLDLNSQPEKLAQ